nr:hypothetical protein [uncultured Mucilaginibacter sp.]
MEIKIPKDKAIEILETCRNKIDTIDFNQVAWKIETSAHLRQIFIDGSRTEDIQNLTFSSLFDELNTPSFLSLKRSTAVKLIQSYIDLIKTYVGDTDHSAILIKSHEAEIEKLLQQLNNVKDTNSSAIVEVQNLKTKISQYEKLDNEQKFKIEGLKGKIAELNSHVFQTENINAKKLWKLWFNLPGTLQISTFTFIATVFAAGVFIGFLFYTLGIFKQ